LVLHMVSQGNLKSEPSLICSKYFSGSVKQLHQHQAAAGLHFEDAQIGDDQADHAPADDRQRAFSQNLGLPSFAGCSITAATRFAPDTKSMAQPGPLTILPGTIPLAMSLR